MAKDDEINHGLGISWTPRAKPTPEHILEAWSGSTWIVELHDIAAPNGKTFQAYQLLLTSLRTTREALLRLLRQHWSLESWHWICDTQLHQDACHDRGNSAEAMAMRRTAASCLLRLNGDRSIQTGMQAALHNIATLLAMARRQPKP